VRLTSERLFGSLSNTRSGEPHQGEPHRTDQGGPEMAASTFVPARTAGAAAPALRLVAAPVRRRRPGGVVIAGLLALMIGMALMSGVANARQVAPEVGGHVVVQPGETLWDVAVRSAGPGVDPRHQLQVIRDLNGLPHGGAVDAWTVVLLPAR